MSSIDEAVGAVEGLAKGGLHVRPPAAILASLPFDHDRVRRKPTRRDTMTDMPAATWPPTARGYFAIGAERMSKSLNLGNLMRSAHGFGASFTFTVGATYQALEAQADTSKEPAARAALQLGTPRARWRCRTAASWSASSSSTTAIDLPSFRPSAAGGLCARARAGLAVGAAARALRLRREIPTSFCVNVAMAGAIVMYDRMRTLGRFADRPIREGGPERRPSPACERRRRHAACA